MHINVKEVMAVYFVVIVAKTPIILQRKGKIKKKNGFAKFIAMYLSSCTCIS